MRSSVSLFGIRSARRRYGILPVLLLSLAASSWLTSCVAGRPLVTIAAQSIAHEASDAEAAVSIELDQRHFALREDGTWKETWTLRYKILSREALPGWSEISTSYSPWYARKPLMSARIMNAEPGGKLREDALDPKTISEEPANSQAPDLYGDSRIVRAPLPNVKVGTIVEQTIVRESHRSFLHPAHLHHGYFGYGLPIERARMIVDAPNGLPVTFKVSDAQVRRSEEQKGDRRVTTFEGGPYPALKEKEENLPPEVIRWPNVAMVVTSDWSALARTYEGVVNDALAGIDFRKTVAGLVAPDDAPKLKVAKLLRWAKDRVRYVGVEFGSSAVVPYPPDTTIARGFGDCKDQATLMVGLLRAAGLQAEVALLSAGGGEDISPDLPALNVFDHAIVHVSAPEEFYLDPTADYVVPGELPIADQGRYALVAGGSQSGLQRTPEPDVKRNHYDREVVIWLKGHGAPEVKETVHARGYFETNLRRNFGGTSERVDELIKSSSKSYYGAEGASLIKLSKTDDLTEPFRSEVQVTKATIGKTETLTAWVNLSEGSALAFLPSEPVEGVPEEKRSSPFYLSVPHSTRLTWNVVPPPGFRTAKLPVAEARNLGVARLVREVKANADGSFTMTTEMHMPKSRLSADEVTQFQEQYAAWAAGTAAQATFEHSALTLAQNGQTVQAAQVLRGALQAAEEPAWNHLRLAHVIRPLLPKVALEEAQEAVRLAPDDVELWKAYAAFVSDNDRAVDLGKGYSRAESLRAYKRISELEPTNTEAKLRQAVVLEHPEDDDRYWASREDLLSAVAIYDSIPAKELREYGDGKVRNNVLFTLFWAQQNDELARRLQAMPAEDAPSVLRFLNEAVLSGPAAAITLLDQLDLEPSARTSFLESGSAALVRRADYAGATQLLDAVRAEGEQARTLAARADMLRGLKHVRASELPMDTAEQFCTRMQSLAFFREEDDKKFAEAFLARGALLEGEDSPMLEVVNELRATTTVPRDFMLDVLSQGLRTIVDGSPKTGYRVKQWFGQGQESTTKHYVVQEDGQWKLRASGGHLREIGAGAWEALKAGNRVQAEQWLSWAREDLSVPTIEDPLRVPPFGRLWKDGKGDAEGAAAALAAGSGRAKEVLPYLEQRLKAAKTDEDRQTFLLATYYAHAHLKHVKETLAAGRDLYQLVPSSKVARDRLLAALWDAELFAEYETIVRAALRDATTESERMDFQGRLASIFTRRGDLAAAKRAYEEGLTKWPNQSGWHNNLAWLGAFLGPSADDVAHAKRSLELRKSTSTLHTLSSLYADLGRIEDAARTLTELLDSQGGKYAHSDYFIVGRIAEHLGFPEEAREAYKRVKAPEWPSPTSVYHLAQKRLKMLER